MPIFIDEKAHRTSAGPGVVIVDDGWPEKHHVARDGDAIAATILAYRDKWQKHELFPASPWSARHGRIHLHDLNEPEPATDDPPVYRLKTFGAVNGAVHVAGATLRFDGWLNRTGSNLMSNLEPINESAHRVHAYTQKFLQGRQMPGQPYSASKLDLPNPALFGRPEPASHRGSFGGVSMSAPMAR